MDSNISEKMKSIKHQTPGQFEVTRFEKVHNIVFSNSEEASISVAREIADLIRRKEANGKKCILGLATGSSPIKVYEELVRMHNEEGLSFSNVVTFNLDEYFPMEKNSVHSYYYFMHQHLFNHVDILSENINIPDGMISDEDLHQYCIDYDRKINENGGLDFQLLGIGRTGHIGFNEPGSHYNSGTRGIILDHLTRTDAAPDFLEIDNVPKKAITMGIRSVMKACRIVLLAWGNSKGTIVKEAIEGEISSEVPATYLQKHLNTTYILNSEAARELTRVNTPWIVSACIWTNALACKAVMWLCNRTGKSILKLTDKDYNDNGLSSLLVNEGSSYNLNIKIFNKVQHTITGWPGGKPNADDSSRPERAEPSKKRVIVFSPHPIDDVISMGGTIDRLVEQGHEVHIAYQTSGNIGVSDHEALKFAEVIKNTEPSVSHIDNLIASLNSKEGDKQDDIIVRNLKGAIRKGESLAATRYLGIPDNRVHFLNLPFYETGTIKKNPASQVDIQVVSDLIEKVKPHQIYGASDLSDPHGTHKVCLDILMKSLKDLKKEDYMKDCWLWFYRGAMHEWDIYQIDMAVPMSPDQVLRKRHAIFFHQSQKDRVLLQGDDTKEFSIRAEERNKKTAIRYNSLGLADYAALEVFQRYYF